MTVFNHVQHNCVQSDTISYKIISKAQAIITDVLNCSSYTTSEVKWLAYSSRVR